MNSTWTNLLKRTKAIIIVCLLFCPAIIWAQESGNDMTLESLEEQLTVSQDTTRLAILQSLINITLSSDQEKWRTYMSMLEKEAEKYSNVSKIAFVKAKWVEYYYTQFDTDSIFIAAADAEDYARRNQLYYYLFFVQQTVAQRYTDQGMYAHGLDKARKMYTEAIALEDYLSIARAAAAIALVYTRMDMIEESLKYSDESLRWLDRIEDEQIEGERKKSISVYLQNYMEIASSYQTLEMPDKVILYADSMHFKINEIVNAGLPEGGYMDRRYIATYYYTSSYLEKGELEKAIYYYNQCEEMLEELAVPYYIQLFNHLSYMLYRQQGNYKLAMEYVDELLEFYTQYGFNRSVSSFENEKSQLYVLMGDYKNAVESLNKSFTLLKEDNKKEFQYQINELRTLYDLHQVELVTEQQQLKLTSARYLMIALLSVLFLVIGLGIVMFIAGRRLQKKNYSLYQQIKDQDRLKEELEKQNAQIIKLKALTQLKQTDTSETADELYERVKKKMEKGYYTDPHFNWKTLVDMLNTNEKYLRDALKNNLGLTISGYINNLRLNHAKGLLSDPDYPYTIDSVAMDSGFGSRATFYRVFREKYGLSPDEYRQMSVLNKN
ncbi:helix-turn-helix transcriptional regulator [Parabacteroides sp. OttesenSCG-928-K15]|nr:helix-turn-helix transcriptional regulator [Parabacteroides sp. OttesenSCG-928-K15]